jgi:hypothetical protein
MHLLMSMSITASPFLLVAFRPGSDGGADLKTWLFSEPAAALPNAPHPRVLSQTPHISVSEDPL